MQSVLIVKEDEVIQGLVRAIVSSAGLASIEVTNGDDAFNWRRSAQWTPSSSIVSAALGSGTGTEMLVDGHSCPRGLRLWLRVTSGARIPKQIREIRVKWFSVFD